MRGEGKKKVVHCITKHRIKQNVSSVEACKGPKSQTKIASEGTCVCVRLLHPHQPCPRQALKTTTSKTSTFGAQPNSTVAIQAKGQISAGAALFEDLDLLCMHYQTTISDTNLKNSVYVNSNRDMVFALCLSNG